MKKFETIRGRILKCSSMLLAALSIIVMASCSNGVKDDMEALFNTVPADATVVVSGNLEKIVDQLGGEVKGGKITSFGNLKKMGPIAQNDEVTRALTKIEKISESIKAGAFVGFVYKSEGYATCFLSDVDSFKAGVAKERQGVWEKRGKFEILDSYAIIDDRLWITDHPSEVTLSDFMGLSETQSFLSCEYSSTIADSNNAADIWVSLDAIYSTLPFAQQAQARMGVSMLFDSPKFLTGDANFSKTGCEITMLPRTADYKASKCVIDLAKIDSKKVASLGGNANIVAAMAVSPKLIGQIKDLGSSMGGALPTQMMDILSPLDGTLAFATQADSKNSFGSDDGFRAVVSTNGKQNAMLGQVLESLGSVKIEGNDFNISKGSYGKGNLSVAEVAMKMDGAWLGVAGATKEDGKTYHVIFLLTPKDGSLAIKLTVNS